MTARLAFEDKCADPHRKIGRDVRANLSNSVAPVVAAVHGDGLASLQFREKTAPKRRNTAWASMPRTSS